MSNLNEFIFFTAFLAFIALMLSIDLGIFQKKNHALSFKEALIWTLIWIGVSLGFYVLIRFHGNWIHGSDTLAELQYRIVEYNHPISISGLTVEQAIDLYNKNLSLEYITGYLIEYSLSVDNVFVIILIFLSFNIQPKYFKRVLFWGIIGAVVMRFIFIFAASALIQRFAWFLLIFGGLLIVIGIKMAYEFLAAKKEERIDTEKHPVVKLISRFFKVSSDHHAETFFIRKDGALYVTPLFIVLLIIEFSDVLFAVDSVPAVFSVTQDPYIVFFSNIFAILGLRSLFFLVMDVINRFYYLKMGLAVLLTFVGVKMLMSEFFHISTSQSLIIIAAILLVSMVASGIRNLVLNRRSRINPEQ
ncbi:MAG: TerC/Alx family metal homeostasis membrane protein [Bacteroidales bacterium]|nr:TerC/Alx family metal homeostasis membrane protein [Bacteroidales bacterium]MDD4603482.1 TerC/Alx family metal homeostasis membrane protein [Bacteroidales bacterium]